MSIASPIIINQMLRILTRCNPSLLIRGYSKHNAVLHYVNKLAHLGILPDKQTFELLGRLHLRLPANFYLELLHSMDSIQGFEAAVIWTQWQIFTDKVRLECIIRATITDDSMSDKIQDSFQMWMIHIVSQPNWKEPNQEIFGFLVNDLKVEVLPKFAVELIQMTTSLDAVDFILENMLLKTIKKTSFVDFDLEYNNTITSHIRKIHPEDQAWSYAFQLNYVGSNDFASLTNALVSKPRGVCA